MRVFVTGATGFIGSALVRELIDAGHQVTGLVRSDSGAQSLTAAGAQPHRGDVEDLESLRTGASAADAVIHLAFIHDFSRFKEVCEIERKAIETMGSVLAGSDRTFIVTSGTLIGRPSAPGLPTTENDPSVSSETFPRSASEETAAAFADRGVRVAIMRLSQIRDTVKQGLVTYVINIAREKGVSAYVGEGNNRWAAAPLLDTAHLYRLALEKAAPFARYHAVAEEGVSAKDIAEAVGKGLKLPIVSITPEEAPAHFGSLSRFLAVDGRSSSAQTRKQLGWNPTGPTLLTDLANMRY